MLNPRNLLAAIVIVACAALPPAMAANGQAAQPGPLKVQGTAGKTCCSVHVAAQAKPAPRVAPVKAPTLPRST